MQRCLSNVNSASFLIIFGFFQLAIEKAVAPILTINASNDVVSRKDVPFGVSKNKLLHFDPIFAKKTQIFSQFATGQKISAQNGFQRGTSSVNTPKRPAMPLGVG